VRVVAGGAAQVREISGSACIGAQNSLLAEFGLGTSTAIDSLIVRWPSGLLQVCVPPDVDQLVTITEGLVTDAPSPVAAASAFWLTASPNPATERSVFRFSLPRQDWVRLEVFDVAGRRVATLLDGIRDAGQHEATFSPQSLGAGVYLYRVRAGRDELTRKLFVVR
jgi:hypothetical protein